MGLIQNLGRGALQLRADVNGVPAPWDDYWYSAIGYSSSSGMRVTPDSAKRIATVLACVGVIGRNLGMMPVKIYTEAPNGSKRIVDHHPLYDVLYQRPNSQQTAFEFKQMMQGHLELRGNAYAKIVPGPRGPVDQLVPMHPDRVRVERQKPSGRLVYRYDNPLTKETDTLLEGEVFHLRNFSDDGATGQSTVAMACDTLGVALAQQDYTARFLANDARPPFFFTGGAFKTKAGEEEFIESWQRRNTAANRGKAGLLPAGMDIKTVGVTPEDQQLLDARKFSRIEICSIFPVPPHLIGETEKTATYASVEQFNIMYAVHCILPRLVLWEQAIQRDLLTSDRYFAKFSMAALLRGDTAARFAAYKIAIENGWMCPDEIRALEDMNPIPDGLGQTFWRPANWSPLGQVAAAAPQLPAAAEPADQTDTADPQDDTGGGSNDGGDAAAARLELLAVSAADRCVRKEVSTLRRMIERGANGYQLEEFYAEHLRFVAEVLRVPAEQLAGLRQRYYERAGVIGGHLAVENRAAALEYVDSLAALDSVRLARLGVKGVTA